MSKLKDSQKHIPALDGVRGLAILMVLLCHFCELLSNDKPYEREVRGVLLYGGIGVDLFFVLSGFLITGILLDSSGSRSYFSSFYMRRVLRIFPLYYAFLLCWWVGQNVIGVHIFSAQPVPWAPLAGFLSYLSNWTPDRGTVPIQLAHLWSLAIEEQFYLVWPLVVFLTPRRFLGFLCAAGILMALGLRGMMVAHHSWIEALHRLTPVRMDTLLMGALLALAYRNDRWRKIVGRFSIPLGLAFGAWYVAASAGYPLYLPALVWRTLLWSAAPAAFACLIAWVVTRGTSSRLFNSTAMRMFGRYSYGIYVLHVLAWYLIPLTWFRSTGFALKIFCMLLLIAISCGMAWISWQIVEQPFLRLKRRFPYEPPQERLSNFAPPPNALPEGEAVIGAASSAMSPLSK
jgi:peptidoglycan/LPS O-acetylase OafA/YrhL